MNLFSFELSAASLVTLAEVAPGVEAAASQSLGRPLEIVATVLFALAVLHTFCVKQFAKWAHKYPEGSIGENVLHFLAETEIVFGIWASILFIAVCVMKLSIHSAVEIIKGGDIAMISPVVRINIPFS